MKQGFRESLIPVWIGAALALIFWTLVFGLKIGNFWLMMTIAISVLTAWSFLCNPGILKPNLKIQRILLFGIISAIVLYLLFAAGDRLSSFLPFQNQQVESIYSNRSQAPDWLISLLLVLVIGPGEEIFWRGFVQGRITEKWGKNKGFWIAVAMYSAVHIPSLNLMLIGAAVVCGLFWGVLYRYTGSVLPGIVSHALWDVTVFVLFPFRS